MISRGTRGHGAALAVTLVLALVPALPVPARAQSSGVPDRAPSTFPGNAQIIPIRPGQAPGNALDMRDRQILLQWQAARDADAPRTLIAKGPVPALSPGMRARVSRAIQLRESGLLERARDSLIALQKDVPHHAVILMELASVHIERGDFAAVERLGSSERLATRDSVLLDRELALAYERLARPRLAMQVALEAWTSTSVEGDWALGNVLRLAPVDPRSARDLMRSATLARPTRIDLARGHAHLLRALGAPGEAVKALAAADHGSSHPPLRLAFAEELLGQGSEPDSLAAIEALVQIAAEPAFLDDERAGAARRSWELFVERGENAEGATRLLRALQGVATERWGNELLLGMVRGLREAGQTREARALIGPDSELRPRVPELALENALADLRDGPPTRALPALAALAPVLPEAQFRYGEALFYDGQADSALAAYQGVAADPRSRYAGAALERTFLLEEAKGSTAARAFGRIAYERWRGENKRAQVLADSLYRGLAPGAPLYAQTALELAALRDGAGDHRGALEPLLAIAEGLPGDRLAPLARQRAGDAYLELKEEAKALAQYEECLARYPKSWNAPEVRRRVEQLRHDRRF